MRVALYTGRKDLQNNRILADANPPGLPDYHNYRWCRLREYLEERNIALNTHDYYDDLRNIDLILMIDFGRADLVFLLRHRIRPSKVILLLVEPPVIRPRQWKYLRYFSPFFARVLMWNTQIASQRRNYGLLMYPQPVDGQQHERLRSQRKGKLCVFVHSNKTKNVRGELYSLRRDVIRYFESRGDHLLDLYGYGWNDDGAKDPFHSSLYNGTTPYVWETMSRYKFAFGIQNSAAPGYIDRDLFDPIVAGTVPIYLGAPNITDFVADNCFIPFEKFRSLDDLVNYLQSIDNTAAYARYRENGWNFVNSENFKPFTIDHFCETLYSYILDVARGGKNEGC